MTQPRCTPSRHVYAPPLRIGERPTYPHTLVCACGKQRRTAALIDDGRRVLLTTGSA